MTIIALVYRWLDNYQRPFFLKAASLAIQYYEYYLQKSRKKIRLIFVWLNIFKYFCAISLSYQESVMQINEKASEPDELVWGAIFYKEYIYIRSIIPLLTIFNSFFWFREAAVAAQGVVNYPLELAVDWAELIGCPTLYSFHCGAVDA